MTIVTNWFSCIRRPLRYVLQLTGLHKMRDFPLLSMPLTLPVSVEAVGYTAASAAAGILDEIGNVRAMMQQEACKYNGISALFESGDIDLVGKLVEAEYISGRVQR